MIETNTPVTHTLYGNGTVIGVTSYDRDCRDVAFTAPRRIVSVAADNLTPREVAAPKPLTAWTIRPGQVLTCPYSGMPGTVADKVYPDADSVIIWYRTAGGLKSVQFDNDESLSHA